MAAVGRKKNLIVTAQHLTVQIPTAVDLISASSDFLVIQTGMFIVQ